MNSITKHSFNQNNVKNSKSNSTIQLKFSESIVQMLTTTYDSNSNSYPSIQQYYSRKRCASKESQRTINEKENSNKKQRAFSENARNQQIFSLSESNEIQQQNGRIIFQSRVSNEFFGKFNLSKKNDIYVYFVLGIICKRSVSIQNDSEPLFDWLKDFMRESLDTIRDTVLQACLTAISTRSITPLNSHIPAQDININNHLTRLVQSEHSLTSHKTNDSHRQNHN